MFASLILFLVTFVVAAHAATNPTATYSAVFNAGGVTGSFELQMVNSEATIVYNIDMSGLSTTCDLSSGLTYHLHNFWTDSANSSTTTCAAAGSHYDPFLACGPSSDNGSKLCTTLGRTAALGYTYGCSASSYADGYYSTCEVGDLSGKFGRMVPIGLGKSLLFKDEHRDPFPPLAVDFNAPDLVSGSQWSSIVIHCPIDNSRLVCAQLVKTN